LSRALVLSLVRRHRPILLRMPRHRHRRRAVVVVIAAARSISQHRCCRLVLIIVFVVFVVVSSRRRCVLVSERKNRNLLHEHAAATSFSSPSPSPSSFRRSLHRAIAVPAAVVYVMLAGPSWRLRDLLGPWLRCRGLAVVIAAAATQPGLAWGAVVVVVAGPVAVVQLSSFLHQKRGREVKGKEGEVK